MRKILTPDEMRSVDERFINESNIPGLVLMENAAFGVTQAVMRMGAKRVMILCGAGNNGGDGLCVLRQLSMRGISACAYLLSSPDKLKGDALKQYDMAIACGLPINIIDTEEAANKAELNGADVVVDAIFGTGLSRPLGGRYLCMINRVNSSGVPVIAADIPSGIDGKTGAALNAAIRANETVTFQYAKRGHMLMPGREHTGRLTIAPIAPYINEPQNAIEQWEHEDAAALLPKRPMDSHKGKNGRALLIAGSERYTGAAVLSATAALRAGAGLLYAAIPIGCAYAFSACPAAICNPMGEGKQWDACAARDVIPLLKTYDAIAIGPGMGDGAGIRDILSAALDTKKPVVIDADGLNALSKAPELYVKLHENAILTPHPGEMRRLIQQESISDSVECAQNFARTWGCTLLLKGAASVIAAKNRTAINITGNPGLAKGGSGDVLTGIILALLANSVPAYEAACAGAYLLGSAADEAYALLGTRFMLPMDVIQMITTRDNACI